MKFEPGDFIVHEDGSEMIYRVVTAIGSDAIKEVYFGVWLTRKTKPHITIEREYISIKNKDIDKWEKTDETTRL